MKNNYIIGHQKELDLINAINGKKFYELNQNLRSMINFMFGLVSETEVLHAQKCDPAAKPDFWVEVRGKKHYVSMKTGAAKVVHKESLSTFCSFLREHHMREEIIQKYCFYHFGDGTLDGSGSRRLSHDEILKQYPQEIHELNLGFNEDENLVIDLVMRVVFDGNNPLLPKAEFLYHGDINEGVICDRQQVFERLQRQDYSFFRNPHFGMIFVYPYARYIDFRDYDPKKRFFVSFEWVKIKEDIKYLSKKFAPKRDY